MYWILEKIYNWIPIDLGLYVILECEESELAEMEKRAIYRFKPVLNTQNSMGFMRKI